MFSLIDQAYGRTFLVNASRKALLGRKRGASCALTEVSALEFEQLPIDLDWDHPSYLYKLKKWRFWQVTLRAVCRLATRIQSLNFEKEKNGDILTLFTSFFRLLTEESSAFPSISKLEHSRFHRHPVTGFTGHCLRVHGPSNSETRHSSPLNNSKSENYDRFSIA